METGGRTKQEQAIAADGPTKAKRLLDTLSQVKDSSVALGRITNKFAGEGPITAQDVRDLELIYRALMNVYKLGRKQAAAVSPVPYLLKAHALRAEEEEVMFGKKNRCPNKVTKEIWKLRCSLSPRKKPRHAVLPVLFLPQKFHCSADRKGI